MPRCHLVVALLKVPGIYMAIGFGDLSAAVWSERRYELVDNWWALMTYPEVLWIDHAAGDTFRIGVRFAFRGTPDCPALRRAETARVIGAWDSTGVKSLRLRPESIAPADTETPPCLCTAAGKRRWK
jgi:hypothetical protein